jgi:PTH2 family peptidyl-tRNA hydrolase
MILKQVFIINSDLQMGKGKIAVQAAHGEVYYMNYLNQSYSGGHTEFSYWMKDGIMKKIALKATEVEMRHIMDCLNKELIWFYGVEDLGLTQVPANSLTCIVVEPLPEETTERLFGAYKLL